MMTLQEEKLNLLQDSLNFICSVVYDCIRQRMKSLKVKNQTVKRPCQRKKTSERNGRSYLLRDEAVREEKRKPLENCVSAVEAENLREEKINLLPVVV